MSCSTNAPPPLLYHAQADLAVAHQMSAHLAAFAIHGDPGAEACTACDMEQHAWPAYTLAHPRSLRIDTTSSVYEDVQLKQCAFWDAHPYFGQVPLLRSLLPAPNHSRMRCTVRSRVLRLLQLT